MTTLLLLLFFCSKAQEKVVLDWTNPIEQYRKSYLHFEGAVYENYLSPLPICISSYPLNGVNKIARLLDVVTEKVTDEERELLRDVDLSDEFFLSQSVGRSRDEQSLQVRLVPLRNRSGRIEKLKSFSFEFQNGSLLPSSFGKETVTYASSSVLSNGNWYKMSVVQSGVHKIGHAEIQAMGIDPNSISPSKLAVYGYGGGMMPEKNNADRQDDLIQNPIWVSGSSDGSFDQGDYILFYARGPNDWNYNKTADRYFYENNIYTNRAFYFLTTSETSQKLVAEVPASGGTTDYASTGYDLLTAHEKDEVNLIRSGREWYGEQFDIELQKDFAFNLVNLDAQKDIWIRCNVLGRSFTASNHYFEVNGPGGLALRLDMSATTSYYLDAWGHVGQDSTIFRSSNSSFNLNLRYSKPEVFSRGHLNFIELNARGNWKLSSSQQTFRDKSSIGNSLVQYSLSNANGSRIWDVTDEENIVEFQSNISAGKFEFQAPGDTLRTFVAFTGSSFPTPVFTGKVVNQNLHASSSVDMICIAYPPFKAQAERLCQLHQKRDGLSFIVVSPGEIFNEFSSGRQDLTAMRHFVRMLYTRAASVETRPKYLLLFGDASYDYKDRLDNKTNLVPTAQSRGSLHPLGSYPTDAYFALMDDDEGEFQDFILEQMDLAVGRLPVGDEEEARHMVDKIERYLESKSFGDWKNIISIIADDQDGNLHLQQGQGLSGVINRRYPVATIDKIFLDAYPQISNAGSTSYPDVNTAINNRFNKGALLVGYIGHGGTAGFAEERVLTNKDIDSWSNSRKLPVMVTATCELSRYDDANEVTSGERILLKSDGGAVALLTTVRTTFANENYALSIELYNNHLFNKTNGEYPTLGEACYKAMNPTLNSINTRSFTLLGDPALSLAYPKESIKLTELNNLDITLERDTLSALSKINVKGDLADSTGALLSGFNGTLIATIYDKASNVKTLVNDPSGFDRSLPATFKKRENVIYKGEASVSAGKFDFDFIVPKDIAYNFDYGRLSFYAFNNDYDASGTNDSIIVGGTSSNPVQDEEGPEISLYMNDYDFVNGGITNTEPLLIAVVSDSSGINTIGNGIGHDVTAILDENGKPIQMNSFYQAAKDNFRKGEVRFPFSNLEQGEHSVIVKVWDVVNNSGDARLDFVVADEEDFAIRNLLNYPNPFSSNTTFHFDHNRPGQTIEAQIQIYATSGKLVKSISGEISDTGFHNKDLVWDGFDDYGDRIGRGVYVYRLRLRTESGEYKQATQKLVLLR